MIRIAPEGPDDGRAIEALLDRALGPNWRAKTVERLREGRLPAAGLSLVARDFSRDQTEAHGVLAGTVRLWPVAIGDDSSALLLGPLAVDGAHRNRGLGGRLVRAALARARRLGHGAVILVGDGPYYGRFGFRTDLLARVWLPGPVDRARFLGLELLPGALAGSSGVVRPAGPIAVSAVVQAA
jgi:predicted N-acetyltransferase YhbS